MTKSGPAIAQKLRIGFLSMRFYPDHIISVVTGGMLKHFPRDRFEVFALYLLKDENKATDPTLMDAADAVVRIHHTGLDHTRRQIAALELDVLVYVDIGMDSPSFYLPFSRLAHVQCVWGGHPNTTGIPNMDYFLSSKVFELPDAQEHYSERLIQFDNPACYFPAPKHYNPVSANLRKRLSLSDNTKIYSAPVTPFKYHPDFDTAIIAILNHDQNSIFVMIDAQEPHFSIALRHRILSKAPHIAHRLLIHPGMVMEEFLGYLQEIDACLDTFYFGAGTTAYLAFGLGVPLITLPSPYLRGRLAAGTYEYMGITDPIATDFNDFVNKAVRLANDKAWQNSLHNRLLEKCDMLFEQVAFLTEMADFFEAAVNARLKGDSLVSWPLEIQSTCSS